MSLPRRFMCCPSWSFPYCDLVKDDLFLLTHWNAEIQRGPVGCWGHAAFGNTWPLFSRCFLNFSLLPISPTGMIFSFIWELLFPNFKWNLLTGDCGGGLMVTIVLPCMVLVRLSWSKSSPRSGDITQFLHLSAKEVTRTSATVVHYSSSSFHAVTPCASTKPTWWSGS